MHIERHFTVAGQDPLEGIAFAPRDSRIPNPDGSVVFEAVGVRMPSAWSQVAVDIMAQKYFRKAGVADRLVAVAEDGVPEWLWRSVPAEDSDDSGGERDAGQVFHRLAGTWAYWGWKNRYFDSEEDARTFYDELILMMATQRAAPNSPQWFNTGLHWAYGITGPSQGHSYFDPEHGEVRQSTSAYERPQPHACFIQSVADDLVNEGGIMDLWTREARIFKYGSGTGSNFSRIRGENEFLSGGGKSSGLMSFLKIGDRAAGAIKSGGTTRRAAKMVIVDVDHPDIEEFIDWKVAEEQKVAALVAGSQLIRRQLDALVTAAGDDPDPLSNGRLRGALRSATRDGVPPGVVQRTLQRLAAGREPPQFAAYDTDWQGAAYQTVSGQNANNSVRVDAAFLDAVRDDRAWTLVRRTDGEPAKTLPARELWERIANAAWESADPGLQYSTTINEWHTSPAEGPIVGSNPCSEFVFLDDTACNLASLNLLPFADAEGDGFDVAGFEHATRLWTIVLEISVLMAQYPSAEIARRSHEYRTLGLGYANLGALLMRRAQPYDSPESLAFGGSVTALLTGVSYATSAELAAELGPFPAWELNREAMLRVIRNHRRAAYDAAGDEYEGLTVLPAALDAAHAPPALLTAARAAWDRALELGGKHGYRNAQATLIAPTGTIGLLMDCDTTGVEPDFALIKFKKLAGGGYFRIVNQSVPGALRTLGYSSRQIEEVVAYCAGSGRLEGAPHINRHTLAERGFTRRVLDQVDEALSSAFDISLAFNRFVLGDEFCSEVLGLDEAQLAAGDILGALGFDRTQITEANDHIVGRMTIEGAPHLREEHYPVFDCANRCGRYGTRFIEALAHVRMMAAVQPFLSGAISKTINLPADATVDDVAAVYQAGAAAMLKALALYRDGSKLSQPLSTALLGDADEVVTIEAGADPGELLADVERIVAALPSEDARVLTMWLAQPRRGQRERVPERPQSVAQKARVGGHTVYLHSGQFPDGRLGEIFISTAKDGAAFRSLMNCFAIAVSIGLQHGVPLETYCDAFTFTKFEPSGVVTGNARIQMATSIIDYIFRELAVTYLDRDDLAHVGPLDLSGTALEGGAGEPVAAIHAGNGNGHGAAPAPAPRESPLYTAPGAQPATAPGQLPLPQFSFAGQQVTAVEAQYFGFEGDPCMECGQLMMVRSGTCLKCMACGATSGCS